MSWSTHSVSLRCLFLIPKSRHHPQGLNANAWNDSILLIIFSFRLVEQVCDKYRVSNTTSTNSVTDFISENTQRDQHFLVERVKLNQFYASRPHQVLGCLINKVASSSIVKTFLKLDGRIPPNKDVKSPHAYAKKLYPKVGFSGAAAADYMESNLLSLWTICATTRDSWIFVPPQFY